MGPPRSHCTCRQPAAFPRNLARGEAYQAEAPTLSDVTYQTAVAQAELEDRKSTGALLRLGFRGADGLLAIETTWPELLPACLALVAHPDDRRYPRLFGTNGANPAVQAPHVPPESGCARTRPSFVTGSTMTVDGGLAAL